MAFINLKQLKSNYFKGLKYLDFLKVWNDIELITTNLNNKTDRVIVLTPVDYTADQTVDTALGGDFVFQFTGTIKAVSATVDTEGTTGVSTIDINLNGTSILSTKITIDSTEKTSATAATAPVLSTTAFSKNDILTIDIDTIHTTAAKGLKVYLTVEIESFN